MRLLDASVERAIRGFAGGRVPGIYKHGEEQLLAYCLLDLRIFSARHAMPAFPPLILISSVRPIGYIEDLFKYHHQVRH